MENKVLFINFNKDYCSTPIELLNSDLFKRIMTSYVNLLDRKDVYWWSDFRHEFNEPTEDVVRRITNLFKLSTIYDNKDLRHDYLKYRETMIRYLEGLYDYYRKFERYSVIYERYNEGYENLSFITADSKLNELLRSTYRTVYTSLKGQSYKVYRQLAEATSAGVVVRKNNLKEVPYENLQDILVVESVLMHVPYIIYPKNNKRRGVFPFVKEHLLDDVEINKKEFVCYPVMVGKTLAFIYIHQDYANMLISVANLFQPATNYQDKKPDVILVYGCKKDGLNECKYYYDEKTRIYVGLAPYGEEITYFGYMKKMLLTLHNSKCIFEKGLPIHGAMAQFVLKNHKIFNVVIMGDSGAGKSETLETLRRLAGDKIEDINTIFDDMGTFRIKDGEVYALGTEIGAFVRLDDLDSSYAYRQIERSVFISPDKLNARVIVPAVYYDDVIRGHKVDLFLYANNYEDKHGIHTFDDINEAKKVFKEGKRRAAATTYEQGLLTSYFANPFGPVQLQNVCDGLIDEVFDCLKQNGVPVGEMYTRLSLDGSKGPESAADALKEIILKDVE